MKNITLQEYLSERLEDQSDWYSKKASENKKNYHLSQVTIITFSALIPFITGVGQELGLSDDGRNVVIALMGVAIAVISAMVSLFKFQEKWTEYRMTKELLEREKINFRMKVGVYANSKDAFDLLVKRVEEILSNERQNWSQYISSKGPESSGG